MASEAAAVEEETTGVAGEGSEIEEQAGEVITCLSRRTRPLLATLR